MMTSRAGTAFASARTTRTEVVLDCQSCGKKYTSANASGLHVCPECIARGAPPPERNKGPVQRPLGIICYVCGREFFEKSIKIHIPQCLKKRAIEQAKLPAHLRTQIKEPTAFTEALSSNKKLSVEQTNEIAFAAYQASMVECQHCGRTFSGQDRLAIHQRACTEYNPMKAVRKEPEPKLNATFPQGPSPSVRQSMPLPAGSRDLAVPAAANRPNTAPAPRPASGDEGRRTPRTLAPIPPSRGSSRPPSNGQLVMSGVSTERPIGANIPGQYGDWSTEPAGDGDLVPCGKCGRKFAASRLGKHEDVCKGPAPAPARKPAAAAAPASPSKPAAKADDGGPSKWQVESMQLQQAMKSMRAYARGEAPPPPPAALAKADDGLVPCPHCGRRFNKLAADRHIPGCANVINKPKPAHKTAQLSDTQIEFRARREGKSAPPEITASIVRSSYVPPPTANHSLPGIARSASPAAPGGLAQFCGSCGTRFPPGATVQFCTKCGKHR
eukprot:TRINITY_DN5677_c1_g1_i3.p1 TRINITY_DN5677_c1_g1~~TRINITY_DN5677_c1_g1_i3.p1  ORF type:complete len:498 (+),score=97.30 TRINITY_DN5677_c1_g1_i3:76-1569(+)